MKTLVKGYWIIQVLPDLGRSFVEYDYDILTSLVKKAPYNKGRIDQFFHRYCYDEDARLTAVETSSDNIIWDKDASYDYNAHGSLKRREIGDDKIQGQDYVSTINGWLKAVNHPDISSDPETDGNLFAKDVNGFVLHYFDGDLHQTDVNNNVSVFNSSKTNLMGN